MRLMPKYLEPYAYIGGDWEGALQKHNPLATRTTLGCTRRCPWCSAWRIEGDFEELDDWEPAPLVIDNNVLASSCKHFDTVVDRLKSVGSVDFNQGLDARLLTKYHADRLAELDLAYIRLAWDIVSVEHEFRNAYHLLRAAGIPKKLFRIYVLIGTPTDTPAEARYRLDTLARLKIRPYVCRFQPLDALEKHQYVAPAWTHEQLQKYVQYWNRVRFHSHIPFDDWDPHYKTRQRLAADRKTLISPAEQEQDSLCSGKSSVARYWHPVVNPGGTSCDDTSIS